MLEKHDIGHAVEKSAQRDARSGLRAGRIESRDLRHGDAEIVGPTDTVGRKLAVTSGENPLHDDRTAIASGPIGGRERRRDGGAVDHGEAIGQHRAVDELNLVERWYPGVVGKVVALDRDGLARHGHGRYAEIGRIVVGDEHIGHRRIRVHRCHINRNGGDGEVIAAVGHEANAGVASRGEVGTQRSGDSARGGIVAQSAREQSDVQTATAGIRRGDLQAGENKLRLVSVRGRIGHLDDK